MIEFRLDAHSRVATYTQLVQRVKQAVRLGRLDPGDRLPAVREVAESLAINPNTVLKAYRELELAGVVEARAGVGTFVRAPARRLLVNQAALERELSTWVRRARAAGWEREDLVALVEETMRAAFSDNERENLA
ncbi:MAG: GntR family transcriptional regulator [Micromonosporaceae bacterium]